MTAATRTQRRYDHRLKELVRTTGNLSLALESGVPRSTAYGWLSKPRIDVVTVALIGRIATRWRTADGDSCGTHRTPPISV